MTDRNFSCSIDSTLTVIGDRWTLLILRDLFRGVRRFEQLRRDLGIAKNILSDRLQKLHDSGIVLQRPYQTNPIRHEYHLSEKGIDLSPSLIALMHWGDRWYADGRPPTILTHATCDTPLTQSTHCVSCNIDVKPTDISSRPGSDMAQFETVQAQ
ncbi:MAG: helix-turn-helix transcriptional regulator [Acidimicrobiales bacterium]|nr:helix-turn-helix transcriptional regulator [Acidimicrobiales bacterium]